MAGGNFRIVISGGQLAIKPRFNKTLIMTNFYQAMTSIYILGALVVIAIALVAILAKKQ